MKNLYIDFDGVIMDTIGVTYDMLDRLEVDRKDPDKMKEFYSNLNWKQLLTLTPIINDGYNCLKKIFASNKFNVAILTHVNSLDEAVAKINHIRKYFKDKVFNTIIPRLVRLVEAPSHGKPINEYDPKSKATLAYANLAKEVISRDGN